MGKIAKAIAKGAAKFVVESVTVPGEKVRLKCVSCGAQFEHKVKHNTMVKDPNNCPRCCKRG